MSIVMSANRPRRTAPRRCKGPIVLMRLRRFNLATLLTLAVIVVAFAACGGKATPADDAPTGGEARAGSGFSEAGTTPSGNASAEGRTATAQDRPRASAAEYSVICEIASRPAADLIEDPYDLDATAAIFEDYKE